MFPRHFPAWVLAVRSVQRNPAPVLEHGPRENVTEKIPGCDRSQATVTISHRMPAV